MDHGLQGTCFRTQKSVPESVPPNKPRTSGLTGAPLLLHAEGPSPYSGLTLLAVLGGHRSARFPEPSEEGSVPTLPLSQTGHLRPLLFPLTGQASCPRGGPVHRSPHGAQGLHLEPSPGASAHNLPTGSPVVSHREAAPSLWVSLQGPGSGQEGQPCPAPSDFYELSENMSRKQNWP